MNHDTIKRNEKLIEELKSAIKEFLDFCNEKRTPYICSLKQTKEGYEEIENFVIKGVVRQGLGISEAFLTYEKMLNPNTYID